MREKCIKAFFLSVAMIALFASCKEEKEDVKIPDISGVYEMTMEGILIKVSLYDFTLKRVAYPK